MSSGNDLANVPAADHATASFVDTSSLLTQGLLLDIAPGSHQVINCVSMEMLQSFNRVASGRWSEVLLTTPANFDTCAVVHAFACLQRMSVCDQQPLTTLLFPWNRNTVAPLRDILVNRQKLCDSIRGPLGRINGRVFQPWVRYVLALQSLRSVFDHNKKSSAL